jgi:leader peptidase (prepilin peptidase) / N-methyltransferase
MVSFFDRGASPHRHAARVWPWIAGVGAAGLAAFHTLSFMNALFAVQFAALALFLARADLDRFELPDIGNLCLFALGMIWTAATFPDVGESLAQALIRAIAAGAFLLAIRMLYRAARGIEGLGMGDVKLAAAGAVWLSWSQMPIALLVAALAGILVAILHAACGGRTLTLHLALPLGAFLAPAIWLVWFAGLAGLL